MGKRHKRRHANVTSSSYQGHFWHDQKEPKLVFHLGKRPIWGGAGKLMIRQPWAMLICCSDIIPNNVVTLSPRARVLMPKLLPLHDQAYIKINWSDGGTPALDAEFWQSLVESVRTLGAPGPIGVCCIGGTGRTGTALAILSTFSQEKRATECPVAFVRRNYYKDAVERLEQAKYITSCTGQIVETPIYDYADDLHSYTQEQDKTYYKCVHGISFSMHCDKCAQSCTVQDKPSTNTSGITANYLTQRSPGHAV